MNEPLELRVLNGTVQVERCMNQVFRPTQQLYTHPGQGYCPTCEYDPAQNKECSRYRPITVTYLLRDEVPRGNAP